LKQGSAECLQLLQNQTILVHDFRQTAISGVLS